MTAPVRLRPDLSEADFLQWVITLAQLHGWLVAHQRPARTNRGYRTAIQGHPGLPDLILARDGTVICAELKTRTGRLSLAQKAWQVQLGDHARVWRPEHAPNIHALLTTPRRTPQQHPQ